MTALILNAMPGPLIWLLFTLVCVAYAVAVTKVGRRLVASRVGRGHNEVGGMILATVGVVYAVLLAFAIIALWERRSTVEDHAYNEVSHLVSAYRDAGSLPERASLQIRERITGYLEAVVTKGYPALRSGTVALESRKEFLDIFTAAQSFEPQGPVQVAWYAEMLTALNSSSVERALRVSATSGSLPDPFWAVLLITTAVTLALGALISMDDERYHIVFMVCFAVSVAALVFLAVILDRPFAGDYALSPEPFQLALESIHALQGIGR